ncbi:MAG: IS21 family transposase [Gammaproteobacteria bacterium]|nr:IS21 family transposase [Gammaproteobacteria bacterium]
METSVKIRRLCLVKKQSISSVARQFNLSRNTVRKYLKQSDPTRYKRKAAPARPKLDEHKNQLIKWLETDHQRPVRERRNATMLYEGIQLQGYKGAYDSVQRFVKDWKSETRSAIKQAYVPLVFAPGEACQFDWSHEQVILGGFAVKIKLAHFRLCHSRKPFIRAYPRETQEMVFDAHIRALEYFGGVPQKMIYDNPKTIVQTIYQGKQRQFNRRFLCLMNHYLIEPVACTPAAGWEKGQVERQVGVMRQRLFTPRVKFADLDELNEWLELRCQQMGNRSHPTDKERTIDDVFVEEAAALRPAMVAFDGYYEQMARVHSTCLVHYDRNQYSVPCDYVGKAVSVRAYADRIVAVADDQTIATHPRSFARGQTCFDPWHYVPILQYKPGALRNGAPFANWDLPKVLLDIKEKYLKRTGGDKEFVQLLLLIQEHSLDAVAMACELAIESGTSRLSVITNMLHRLTEPEISKPLSITDAPVLQTPPVANPGRYDQLWQQGVE